MTGPDTRPHPDDELLAVAAGDQPAAEVAAHLEGCARCRDELAALTEVSDLLRAPLPPLVAPPASAWTGVLATIDGGERPDDEATAGAPGPTAASERPVADLAERRTRGPRRVAAGWLVAAAVAGVLAGGAGVAVLDRGEPEVATTVLGRASLETLDTKKALGSASAVQVDGALDLDVDTPELEPGTGYLEVWLINRDLRRMVSVGVLRPGQGNQRFAIDRALIDQGYVIVDISREAYDDQPQHSGDSLVRGVLPI